MPVWGPALGKTDDRETVIDSQTFRVANLSRYIEPLQVK